MPTKRSHPASHTINHLAVYLLGLEDIDVASTIDERSAATEHRVDVDESAWTLERFARVADLLDRGGPRGWADVTIAELLDASRYLGNVAGPRRRYGLRGFLHG